MLRIKLCIIDYCNFLVLRLDWIIFITKVDIKQEEEGIVLYMDILGKCYC